MRYLVKYNKFLDKDYFVDSWDSQNAQVVVKGCAECKECCGYFYQPLALLPSQDKKLFFNKKGVPCIHPKKSCKQRFQPDGHCLLKPIDKPVLCNIYPFRLVEKRIQAHFCCPAVQNTTLNRLQEIGIKVAEYLVTLPHSFLFEISDCTPYPLQMVDLNIQLVVQGTENLAWLVDI